MPNWDISDKILELQRFNLAKLVSQLSPCVSCPDSGHSTAVPACVKKTKLIKEGTDFCQGKFCVKELLHLWVCKCMTRLCSSLLLTVQIPVQEIEEYTKWPPEIKSDTVTGENDEMKCRLPTSPGLQGEAYWGVNTTYGTICCGELA